MRKEIKYGGLSAVPDDYQSEDGQLAVSQNLLNEDGHLRPLFPPETVRSIPNGYTVLYIHKTPSYSHLLMQNGTDQSIVWADLDQTAPMVIVNTAIHSAVSTITSVGNTLVVMAEDGLHYILWKQGEYKYIGKKPHFVPIQFSVSEPKEGEFERPDGTIASATSAWRSSSEVGYDGITGNTVNFSQTSINALMNTTWALINTTNAQISKDGHFYAPFFVRYAYRLYDGSVIMPSAPVFISLSMPDVYRVEVMCFTNNNNQVVFVPSNVTCTNNGEEFLNNELRLRYRPSNVALTYKIMDEMSLTALRTEWGDIVKGIDIYVSLPITRENDSQSIKTATANFDYLSVYNSGSPGTAAIVRPYEKPTTYINGNPYGLSNVLLDIPSLSDDEYLDKIKSVSSFFKIHTFELSSAAMATSSFEEVPIHRIDTNYVLPFLSSMEVLPDDYHSHNRILPAFDKDGAAITSMFQYNGRLNISAVRERLFEGFGLDSMLPAEGKTTIPVVYIHQVLVDVETENGIITVVHEMDGYGYKLNTFYIKNGFLFYPDNRAKAMYFVYSKTSGHTAEQYTSEVFVMEECPTINGAYHAGTIYRTFTSTSLEENASLPQPSADPSVPQLGKIYTSEVNNPFVFPVSGINTIGAGVIMGISSATRPLSEGQFGQFPLYAFCSDGVWALEVSSTGTFAAKHPVTRDVCNNPDSITQLDSSVLFATDRGIMQIVGSSATCITDIIAEEYPDDYLTSLPGLSSLEYDLPALVPFSEFLSGCRMLYDYIHQRIFVYNPLHSYAYVYSLRSKLWGMMNCDLRYSLNSYPDALAVDEENRLVNFSVSGIDGYIDGIAITRPIKFGSPNMIKSVHTIIQRGLFQRGEVKTVLYGSRDIVHWHLIASSFDHELRRVRGTGYRYFRLAVLTTLADGESVAGLTADVDARHTKKMW